MMIFLKFFNSSKARRSNYLFTRLKSIYHSFRNSHHELKTLHSTCERYQSPNFHTILRGKFLAVSTPPKVFQVKDFVLIAGTWLIENFYTHTHINIATSTKKEEIFSLGFAIAPEGIFWVIPLQYLSELSLLQVFSAWKS